MYNGCFCILISLETEGWEPVQRAGKVRARPLSACVPLAEDNRGTYEFKRSLSAVAVETQSGSSVPLGNQSANSLNALNVLTAMRSSLESIIERKTSLTGSDKENVPINVSGSSTNQVQRTSQKTTEATTAHPALEGKGDISALGKGKARSHTRVRALGSGAYLQSRQSVK